MFDVVSAEAVGGPILAHNPSDYARAMTSQMPYPEIFLCDLSLEQPLDCTWQHQVDETDTIGWQLGFWYEPDQMAPLPIREQHGYRQPLYRPQPADRR
jgi:hypothetical protein